MLTLVNGVEGSFASRPIWRFAFLWAFNKIVGLDVLQRGPEERITNRLNPTATWMVDRRRPLVSPLDVHGHLVHV